jgi:major membrane immunogen (membrane-anchored lipoprotein)
MMRRLAVGAGVAISTLAVTGCDVHDCTATYGTYSASSSCSNLMGKSQRVVVFFDNGDVLVGDWQDANGKMSVVSFVGHIGETPRLVRTDVA